MHNRNMRIKEVLMDQTFSITNSDPYMFSLHLMEELSKDARVVEKKNEYETDGPHHRSTVVFDAVELVDNFSKIVFRFALTGEDQTVRANVKGLVSCSVDETGFFSQMFADYYVKTVFPLLRKISQDKIEFFGTKVEKMFEEKQAA